MLVKEQTTSDNVNFVCKTISELIPDLETNKKNTLIKNLPEILRLLKRQNNGVIFLHVRMVRLTFLMKRLKKRLKKSLKR